MKYILDGAVDIDVFRYIMVDEPEIGIPEEVRDIFCITGDEVINGDNGAAFGKQPIAEMRTKEAGTTCNNRNRLLISASHRSSLLHNTQTPFRSTSQDRRCFFHQR